MFRNPHDNLQFPFFNDSKVMNTQQQRDPQEILRRFRSQNDDIYTELEQHGLNRGLIDNLMPVVIDFLLNQSDFNRPPGQIYSQFLNQYPWYNFMIRQVSIPRNIVDGYILRIIEIVIRLITNEQDRP